MRLLFCLFITLVGLSLQGCGFLDDELLTEDSLFGVSGIGFSGTGRSGCGGGMSIRTATRSARSGAAAAEFDEIELQEFEMDAMNFRLTKAKDQLELKRRNVEVSRNDPLVDLFVQAENQVDSVSKTAQREGVH